MRYLLLVLVIWAARLVAGLPRLYYIDKDSASILQKSDLYPAIPLSHPEKLIPKLIPRAGQNIGANKANPAGNGPKAMPPDISPSSKQAAKEPLRSLDPPSQQTGAVTTRKSVKGKAQSQSQQQLPSTRRAANQKSRIDVQAPDKEQNNLKQSAKLGSQSNSQRIPKNGSRSAGKNKAGGGSQAVSKSSDASLLPSGPKTRSKSGASALGMQDPLNKKQGKSRTTTKREDADSNQFSSRKSIKASAKQRVAGGATGPSQKSVAKQQNGSSKRLGLQEGLSKPQMWQGLRSQTKASSGQRMTRSKTASSAQNKRDSRTSQGRSSIQNAEGRTTSGKNAQRGGKRAGRDLASKSDNGAPQKKRICRRANEALCDEWDIEQGRPPPSQDTQSRTSSAPLVPPLITSMSRTGREYAKTNPWNTATYALSASAAALGNAAGVTDHCCNEECAKTASHVLNYCGMTVGVAGAVAAFTGAVIQHHNRRKEKEEQDKRVEQLTMKTEGHDAVIEDHGRKIEQTDKKFSTELTRTKQTLSQVTKRLGGPKELEDVT